MARFRFRIPTSLSVAWFFAMAVIFVFLLPVVPALEKSMQRNAVLREANRLVTDIQFARAQALTRGTVVNLCRSAITDACRDDAAACGCFAGTGRHQFDRGWLIYTTPRASSPFDPARDTLISLGEPAPKGIVMLANTTMQDGLSLARDGSVAEQGAPRISVCVGDESSEDVPGRMITVSMSGKPEISPIAPGAYCLPPN